jgi:hypothetical protein
MISLFSTAKVTTNNNITMKNNENLTKSTFIFRNNGNATI